METPWSNGRKLLFRFLFIYLILYISPFPLTLFPYEGENALYLQLWQGLVAWIGENVLRLNYTITFMPNGSGDTTFNYVQLLLFFSIALAGSVIWSLFDNKRLSYNKLQFWFTVLIRYYLAVVMLGYGFAKVIQTQFPFPFAEKLLQPVGELSPMGLLWTFMGYSTAYNIFVGMGEVIGGLLLFFRRTTLLGALIISVVMANVVVLNFSYDVPVKLYSLHLLLMSVLLIAPYASRLWRFFVLHKAAEALPPKPLFIDPKKNIVLLVAKILFIGFILTTQIKSGLHWKQQFGDMASGSYYTVYSVDTFIMRGDTIPATLNNNVRWKRVLVKQKGATIEYMDGVSMDLSFASDTTKNTITIGSGYTYQFTSIPIDSTHVLWRGLMGSDSLKVVLRKKRISFPLATRGFHWINEYPYNR